MKKIVLSGSASLQKEINELKDKLKDDFIILDYPKPLDEKDFLKIYPQVHKNFYQRITETDILLIVNFDKKGIKGYIGPAGFAELSFGLSQNLIYNKNIELYILQMPDKSVSSYDEIQLWLTLGWIKIWDKQF